MKQFVQSLLGKFGYRLVKTDMLCRSPYGLTTFFPLLKRLGFAPASILDVGANRGDWTRIALRYFPDAQYTLIEPQDQLKVHVQDLIDRGHRIRWINAGAGDKPGLVPFSISHRDDSSTFAIDEQCARSIGSRRVDVNVLTLNSVCSSQDIPIPDMVKIDAEGFDLKVLQGASELFGKTEIFLVEFGIFCDYENSLFEIIRWMADHGYRPLDLTDLNRSPKHGILWLGEMAFVRNNTRLLDSIASYE
jgi:FkbM family methyltransferase